MLITLVLAGLLACGGSGDDLETEPEPSPRELNQEALENLGPGTPEWTPRLQKIRDLVHRERNARFEDGGLVKDLPTPDEFVFQDESLCPKATEIEKRSTKDEFERRDKEKDLAAATKGCLRELQGEESTAMAEVMVARVPVAGVTEYDFDDEKFMLTTDLGFVDGGLAVWPQLSCTSSVLAIDGFEGSGIRWGAKSATAERKHVVVDLPVPEAEARATKARLEGRDQLMVDVAFRVGDFGKSGVECNYDAVPGTRAEAIGYQVRDAAGTLRAWTVLCSGCASE